MRELFVMTFIHSWTSDYYYEMYEGIGLSSQIEFPQEVNCEIHTKNINVWGSMRK